MDEGAESDKCDWWSKEERIVPAVAKLLLSHNSLSSQHFLTHTSLFGLRGMCCAWRWGRVLLGTIVPLIALVLLVLLVLLSGKVVGVKRLLWCGSVLAHSAGNRGEDTHTPRHSQSTSKKPQKDQPFNAACVHTWVHLKCSTSWSLRLTTVYHEMTALLWKKAKLKWFSFFAFTCGMISLVWVCNL